MEQLLDNRMGELLNGGALARGEGSQAALNTAMLGGADRFGMSTNGRDLGRGGAQAKLGAKSTGRLTRLRICMVHHFTPVGRIHRTMRGEVIKVEHPHPRQRAVGGINVTRDGNISVSYTHLTLPTIYSV